jgi:peptide-methionine (R)-S-oxide reductase
LDQTHYLINFLGNLKKDSELSSELYNIARGKGTEPPFSGRYAAESEDGIYCCAVCGNKLFSSDSKYDSGTGWPSFTKPILPENINLNRDDSDGLIRTEVSCGKCGAHLGHVFNDGPSASGGKRYCINSISLDLNDQR